MPKSSVNKEVNVSRGDRESQYLNIILNAIRVCASYKPKLGQGGRNGWSLADFQKIYGSDPFYSWFGLDNPMMYAAHKAAGGMTSIYRQIGIGSETLFRQILQDELGLTEEQAKWSYDIIGANKKQRRLALDARISLEDIRVKVKQQRLRRWMADVCADLDVESGIAGSLKGVVFEVRQGYKSKDSKRQNADIANAVTAYTRAYLPCAVIMSNQIDLDILHRYRSEKWSVLTGSTLSESPLVSTYAFMARIVGYDLAAFFNSNSEVLQGEVAKVLEALLRADK